VVGENHSSAATMQHVAATMYTALTVGYYEQPVLDKLNADNAFIQGNGGSLLGLTAKEKREANIVDVPLSTQVFDRYAYSQNNPLIYTDPTGHELKGSQDFGYDKQGNIYHLWLDGQEKIIDITNIDIAKYAKIDDFTDAVDAYIDAGKDKAWALVAAGGVTAGVVTTAVLTAPTEVILPGKLLLEIAVVAGAWTAVDFYKQEQELAYRDGKSAWNEIIPPSKVHLPVINK
jgi:hypothetical protein